MSDEQSFLDKAKDFVSDLGEDISEGIEKAGDFIEEKFGGDDAADAVKDAADSAKDAASDAVDSAKDAASDAVNSVKDAADGS
jgi:uncharacterized protein YjbJ (UPF0337 family)